MKKLSVFIITLICFYLHIDNCKALQNDSQQISVQGTHSIQGSLKNGSSIKSGSLTKTGKTTEAQSDVSTQKIAPPTKNGEITDDHPDVFAQKIGTLKQTTEPTTIDIEQLQEIINKLPEKDQKIISTIKVQISTWPQEIFDEISAYREFIINSRKIAKQRYKMLSPETKSALETEKQLKTQLSSETIQTLEDLEILDIE